MARNTYFHHDHEPLRKDDSLQVDVGKIHGPFAFLNPTQAHFQHRHLLHNDNLAHQESDDSDAPSPHKSTTQDGAGDQPASNVAFNWTSRNNRKGRHAIVVKPVAPDAADATYATPRLSSNYRTILHNIWLMVAYYPVWDVSWWVAYIFTWGSIIWVINAFFSFLPDLKPSTTFHNEVLVAGGVTAFIGATVFEIGSVFLMIEAINENREGCFGWAVTRAIDEHFGQAREKGSVLSIKPDKDGCTHHHSNKKNFVGKSDTSSAPAKSDKMSTSDGKAFVWFPSREELRTHYLHELGFLACSAQMFGASVFWISGFTALPGINNVMSHGLLDGIYWVPQVVGGCGFIVSGTLFMIETQKHWWQPAPKVLGWHIGLWNLIGGFGFTLCPIFGFNTASWSQYQAGCSTFWGSWAFLIGSLIQLYESLEKNPVEKQ